ncbi:MAG: carbohydrate kinase family protein [Patescibacteria group bacterium]|nr:carbohydrate kinase family protein [Patescibacteria group bacterium]
MYDVIAIGSTTIDSFWRTDFKLISSKEAPSGKAISIPFGEKYGVEDVVFTLGGNAANASATFARQGLKTALFTKIGGDSIGEEAKKHLSKNGVSLDLLEFSKDKPTSFSVLMLQGGERSILTYHGAINEFTLKNVGLKKLKSRFWYVSLPGESYREFDRVLEYADKDKITIALNPSYKQLMGAGRAKLLKHLKRVDFLVLNDGEAASLVGIPFTRHKEVFKKLDKLVPGIVAVTSGPKGVMVSDGSRIYKAGTFKEKKVVDRTGAGDAFGSGFLSGLIAKGWVGGKEVPADAVKYAIKLASANATSVVEQVGATPGALTRKEFESSSRWKKFKIEVDETN